MNWLDELAGIALRWLLRLLPADRRDWGEALWSELAALSAGRARLRWRLGGLRLAVVQSGLAGRLAATVAMVAGAVAVLKLDQPDSSSGYTRGPIPLTTIATLIALLLMPWLARRRWPPARSAPARVLRVGGYLLIWLLLMAIASVSRFAGARFDGQHTPFRVGDFVTALLLAALLIGYGASVLLLSAHRATAYTLAIGIGCGAVGALALYSVSPFGGPLNPGQGWLQLSYPVLATGAVLLAGGCLVAAGAFATAAGGFATAAGEPGSQDAARWHQDNYAGLCAGLVMALLLTTCTLFSMRLFPHLVPLEWANPDPNVPHATTFEVQMSMGDAASRYLLVLLLLPPAGLTLAAIGSAIGHSRSSSG
jgi:hypothetical protein